MAVDREELIKRLYYQELGRLNPDQAGLEFWTGEGWLDDEAALRTRLRAGAGLEGESVVAPLLADKTYSAFLRNMQFNESQIQSSLQAAQEAAQRRIKAQAPLYDQQRRQSALSTNRNFEARGMYRSGGRLDKLAKDDKSLDYTQRKFESGINDASAEAERQAIADIAKLRRDRAEQELAARDRLTERSVQI